MAAPQKNNVSGSKKNAGHSRALNTDTVDATAVPQDGEQQRMVSEAAYFRAMNRNFDGGDPVEDWLEAEREITTKLSACTPSAEVRHGQA